MRRLYRSYWILLRLGIRVYFRWSSRGAGMIPSEGPFILAANHASFLDPVLAGCAVPREIHYLARASLFRFPAFGWLLRSANALPVDRSGRSPRGLKSVLEVLERGRPVMLFPEGTRTSDGSLGRAHPGVGMVAVRSGAPVVPCRIFGSFEAWSRHHWAPRPRRIQVAFGPPLRDLGGGGGKEAYRPAAERILEAIAAIPPPS